jgi:hypothetical protein
MVLFNSLYLHQVIPLLCFTLFRKIILLVIASATAVENEIPPPFNIKFPLFRTIKMLFQYSLGSGFQLQFDDLYGNEAISIMKLHCDYNWKPSEILKTNICKVLTIRGFRITPTLSTHYNCPIIHCQFLISLQQLRISGNYMLKILNDDKDVVLQENSFCMKI